MIRNLLVGVALLATATAGAQDFASELQMSNNETTYWYRICSALPGKQEWAMTDQNGMNDTAQFFDFANLMKTEADETHSQWQLTKGDDDKVVLTNRATGHQISNSSRMSKNHNVTLFAETPPAPGFKITSLGDNAFMLESVENDGVNRCLAFAEEETEALTYPTENLSTSVIGWKFMLVETVTAINDADAKIAIRVANRRVVVDGCKRWQLFNAQGKEMPHNRTLPAGVYFVKTPKRTVKVVVN